MQIFHKGNQKILIQEKPGLQRKSSASGSKRCIVVSVLAFFLD